MKGRLYFFLDFRLLFINLIDRDLWNFIFCKILCYVWGYEGELESLVNMEYKFGKYYCMLICNCDKYF